jgi:hypothetical protein
MELSEPKQITFIVAVVLAVIGLLATLITIPVLSGLAFWILLVGFIVLAVGNLIKGL